LDREYSNITSDYRIVSIPAVSAHVRVLLQTDYTVYM